MKTKFFFAAMLLACGSFALNAQGYKDGIDFYKIGKLDDAKELLERNLNNAETNKAEAYYYLVRLPTTRETSLLQSLTMTKAFRLMLRIHSTMLVREQSS